MTDYCRGTAGALSAALTFCSLIGTGMSIVKVDVRCYCNLPACSATGYMCRSSWGLCASERGEGEEREWRHACLEMLLHNSGRRREEEEEEECEDKATRRRCCAEDMCNYSRKSFQRGTNHSHLTGYLSNHDTSLLRGGDSMENRLLFFRTMLVAVPLAGALVLAVLVTMAAKILRVEGRHRELQSTTLKPVEEKKERPPPPLLPKSLSCVLLGRTGQTGHVIRGYASTGSIGGACHSSALSLTPSTDSGCTDSSREKYFVFDV